MFKKSVLFVFSLLIVSSMLLAACQAPAAPTMAPEAPTNPPPPAAEATQPPAEATQPPAEVTEPPAATEPPAPTTDRKGGWLDEIVFQVAQADSALTQLEAGAIDIYPDSLTAKDLPAIKESGLKYSTASGLYYDMLFNPAGPVLANGTLNPFADRKIREAMNWAVDRNYINQEIFAGGALPKWFAIATQMGDYADLADTARALEAKYAYDLEKAKEVVTAEMESLGATLTDGKWMYEGNPVTIVNLIRNDSDGTRIPMGDYFSAQLEQLGFTVDSQYKTGREASPIWLGSDPKEGQWHVYTAAWSSTVLDRDQGNIFQEMYLPTSAQGEMVFTQNQVDPEFQKVGDDLANANYKTLEERHEMMIRAMELSLEDSLQVFLIDGKSFIPYRSNVIATSDLAAGVQGSQIWPFTLRFDGEEGGTLRWGASDNLFASPWNPVSGSNWTSDQSAIRATSSGDIMYDPYTGLIWPLRIEKAEVTVQTGLPVFKTLDWVTLNTADEIAIPDDAIVEWDAVNQVWLTKAELVSKIDTAKAAVETFNTTVKTAVEAVDVNALNEDAVKAFVADVAKAYEAVTGAAVDVTAAFDSDEAKAALTKVVEDVKAAADAPAKQEVITGYAEDIVKGIGGTYVLDLTSRDVTTALRKSVVTYPADLFEITKWHDGSNLSMADIEMMLIMSFDRANPASAIYDPSAVSRFQFFLSSFKGFKITSEAPLTIEWYSDAYSMDAELSISTIFPTYDFGEGGWPVIAISNAAEAAGEAAYSEDKAASLEVEQLNYIGGPTLEILANQLDKAIADKTIPYAPTMSKYLTADEAVARYQALKDWYGTYKHFWVGTGPYFLDNAALTEKTLTLKHFDQYPDSADRWSNYAEPKLATVEFDGRGQVKIGEEAVFDVYVTFEGEPYPNAELKAVKFLLYDAENTLVTNAEAAPAEDGHFTITLTKEDTAKLAAGANKIEVAVISDVVSQPTFASVDFVTVP